MGDGLSVPFIVSCREGIVCSQGGVFVINGLPDRPSMRSWRDFCGGLPSFSGVGAARGLGGF